MAVYKDGRARRSEVVSAKRGEGGGSLVRRVCARVSVEEVVKEKQSKCLKKKETEKRTTTSSSSVPFVSTAIDPLFFLKERNNIPSPPPQRSARCGCGGGFTSLVLFCMVPSILFAPTTLSYTKDKNASYKS